VKIRMGIHPIADGSCEYCQGLTRILVTVEGPKQAVSGRNRLHDRASLNVFITSSTFAKGERKQDPRRSDRRDRLLRQSVEATLESTLLLKIYPRSQIDVFVTVLQHDAGVKSAVLNACTLALVYAGLNFRDLPFACDAKIVNDVVVADPNQHERNCRGPLMTVVQWVHSKKIITLQMERPLSIEDHDKLIKMACHGVSKIHDIASNTLEKLARTLTTQADPHGFLERIGR